MSRQRMTWNESGDARQRRASSNENTNTKSAEWGEDPHPGPYENGEHPATPDDDSAHPAAKAATLERKAAKCIRIASAMLGEGAPVSAIEDQALALMDLSDRSIKASLSRISGDDDDMDDDMDDDDAAAAEGIEESKGKKAYVRMLEQRVARMERVLTRIADSEDPEGDSDDSGSDDPEGDDAKGSEDPGEESKGKKARNLRARARRLLRLAEKEDDEEAKDDGESKGDQSKDHLDYEGDKKASEDEEASDEDEEASDEDESKGKKAGYMDEESMLDEMLLEEMLAEESMHEEGHIVDTAEESMGDMDEMVEVSVDPVGDPMGLMEDDLMAEDEMMVLGKLFGKEGGEADEDKAEKEDHDKGAIKDDEDHIADLEEDKDEDEKDLDKEESKGKKAARRPQPKKASAGATRLGGVSKGAASEINELSQLWESAPDVSKFF